MALTLTIVFALIAGACITLGIQGRRVGTTPHCRRCGFDLSGTPTDTPDAICPECGAALNAPGAIRLGTIRRRGKLLATGLVLLAPLSVCLYFATAGRGPIPASAKPTALLLLEARTLGDPRAETAVAELMTRRLAGNLTDRQVAALVDRALTRMENPTHAWVDRSANQWPHPPTPWNELFTDAFVNDLLTTEQTERAYAAAVPTWSLRSRIRLIEGDAIRFTVPHPFGDIRLGAGLAMLPRATAITFDGQPVEPATVLSRRDQHIANWRVIRNRSSNSRTVKIDRKIPSPPTDITPTLDGETTRVINASITWELDLYEADAVPEGIYRTSTEQLGPPIATHTEQADYTIEVYASPADGLTLATDNPAPDVQPRYFRNRTPNGTNEWSLRPTLAIHGNMPPPTLLEIRPQISRRADAPDADIPAEHGRWVVATLQRRLADGTLVPVGQSQFNADEPLHVSIPPPTAGAHSFGLTGVIDLPDRPATIDIVLVPDPAHALRHTQADTLWNEPIVLEDIPLDWSAVEAAEAEEANNLAPTP